MHILLWLAAILMTIGPVGTPVPPPAHPEGIPVKVVVSWQGATHADLPYTVQIDDDVRGVVQQFDGVTDAQGALNIAPDLVCGATAFYWVKGPKYLGGRGTFVVDCSQNDEAIALLAGDTNNDNQVDVTDLGILQANFGLSCNMASDRPAFDDGADLNGDCLVNIVDYNLLRRNYGQVGAPPLQ